MAVLLLAGFPALAAAQKSSPAVTRDADRDGIPDVRDRCPAEGTAMTVNPVGCPPPGAGAPAPVIEVPQTVAPSVASRVGLGVGVSPGYAALLIPILSPGGLMIEPEIMVASQKAEFVSQFSPPQSSSATTLRIGVTLAPMLGRRGPLRTYVGARIGLIQTWLKTDQGGGNVSTESLDWYAALALGGEVTIAPSISLGGEVFLSYTRMSDDTGGGFTVKQREIATSGRIAVRWYAP